MSDEQVIEIVKNAKAKNKKDLTKEDKKALVRFKKIEN